MNPSPLPDTASAPRTANRVLLLLIAGVFVLPIVIAWMFVSGAFGWRPAALTNHGTLLVPPIDISTLPASAETAPLRALPPADWALLYVSDQPCDEACSRALRELAAMPMVIGKHGTRLHVFGLFTAPQPETGIRQLVDRGFVRAIAERLGHGEQQLALPFIGFLDWRAQLMMHFRPSAPPDDVKRDLKRLLTASAIN